jgi:hypothetical protein
MGNVSSQAVDGESQAEESVFSLSNELQGSYPYAHNHIAKASPENASSGVSNSFLLCLLRTEEIAQQYNNEQIVKLFGKQVEAIGAKKAQLLRDTVETRTKLQQHMEAFRTQNKQIHAQLDQSIEKLEDKFSDLSNVVEYDAARLEKKHLGGSSSKTKAEIPCLGQRTNVATCFSATDPVACDAFVEALEACASKTIAAK